MKTTMTQGTRREFFRTAAVASSAAMMATVHNAYAQDIIKVGLIGCGRRGTGAARDCVTSSDNVVLTAMGDVFSDKLDASKEKLQQSIADKFKVEEDACFTGFDAFEKVINADVDLVLLTAPPAFRPQHLEAAVKAGKHVFMEKPVAVDPVGVRAIIASGEKAKQKKLGIVAGTQRRHHKSYQEILRRVHDGAIGDLVAGQFYWVGDYGYYKPVYREDSWSDMEWQLRNWNYFTWLSGDHIVEQHVHNLDIMNWAFQGPPVKAFGLGGRQQRIDPVFGHIYDHFAVEFEYANGVRVHSLCRQNRDTYRRVDENLVGTNGTCFPKAEIFGPKAYKYDGPTPNPYVQEHADLITSIRDGAPLNEAKTIAESTMSAIIGRIACYTGQEVTWDWAMNESKLDLTPVEYTLGSLPDLPIAIPGYTEMI